MNNTTERSSILLVVLGSDAPTSAIRSINVALLQSLFEHFGTLQKIIIFNKDVIVKAFLEFTTPEDAVNAKFFLHGTILNNLGSIKIFFSALQKLEFSGRFVESKDFNPNRAEIAAQPGRVNTHKAKVTAAENLSNQKPAADVFQASKKRSAHQLTTIKNEFSNTGSQDDDTNSKGHTDADALSTQMPSVHNSLPEPSGHCKTQSVSRDRKFSHDYLVTLDSLNHVPVSGEFYRPSMFSLQQPSMQFEAPEADSVTPQVDLEIPEPLPLPISPPAEANQSINAPVPSAGPKVILLSNLDDFFFAASEVFNLFSCFGNIVRVLLMKNLKKALVEFKRTESAEVAVNFMNNRQFGRSKLKVVMSKFKKIDLKRNNKSENSQNFNEVIVPSNKMNRFKNSSHNVIAPTDTLLVVVEKDADMTLSDVMLGVQLYAKPIRSKTLEEQAGGEGVELHQVMFKFQSIVSAMKVLAQVHNSEVKGHFLSVTFAPSML